MTHLTKVRVSLCNQELCVVCHCCCCWYQSTDLPIVNFQFHTLFQFNPEYSKSVLSNSSIQVNTKYISSILSIKHNIQHTNTKCQILSTKYSIFLVLNTKKNSKSILSIILTITKYSAFHDMALQAMTY